MPADRPARCPGMPTMHSALSRGRSSQQRLDDRFVGNLTIVDATHEAEAVGIIPMGPADAMTLRGGADRCKPTDAIGRGGLPAEHAEFVDDDCAPMPLGPGCRTGNVALYALCSPGRDQVFFHEPCGVGILDATEQLHDPAVGSTGGERDPMQMTERVIAPIKALVGKDHRIVEVRRVDDVRIRERHKVEQRLDSLKVGGAEDQRPPRRLRPNGADEPRGLGVPNLGIDRGLVEQLQEQALIRINRRSSG
jgi:hypothetical protein